MKNSEFAPRSTSTADNTGSTIASALRIEEALARLGPQADRKITDLLCENAFTLSAEVVPPRNGSGREGLVHQIAALKDSGALFMSVTKGAGGSLRGGSLPIAQIIKENFRLPCIAHFTSRDLLPEEVENQLIDHHFVGIRNILALRGDPPQGIENWTPREGSYPYAYQLVEQIQSLNQGRYIQRNNFGTHSCEPMDFCVGVACYPDQENREEHMRHFKRKVDAGGEYAISQMIFCADSYARFCEEAAAAGAGIPVLPGTRILKSRAQAEKMSARFGIPIPASYTRGLAADDRDPAATEASLTTFLEYVDRLKRAGAPGLHLFVLSDTEVSSAAIAHLTSATR